MSSSSLPKLGGAECTAAEHLTIDGLNPQQEAALDTVLALCGRVDVRTTELVRHDPKLQSFTSKADLATYLARQKPEVRQIVLGSIADIVGNFHTSLLQQARGNAALHVGNA